MAVVSGPLRTHELGEARVGADVGLGSTTVWLRGDQDLSTSSELAMMVDDVVAHGVGDVILDLSAVSFMDAGTVGRIVGARNRLEVQSRGVVIREPSESARRALEICGLLGTTGALRDRDVAGSDP